MAYGERAEKHIEEASKIWGTDRDTTIEYLIVNGGFIIDLVLEGREVQIEKAPGTDDYNYLRFDLPKPTSNIRSIS